MVFVSVRCVVGEEKDLFSVLSEIVYETDGKVEYVVSEIDSTVHVKNIKLLFGKYVSIGICKVHFLILLCFLFLPYLLYHSIDFFSTI